MCTNARSLGEHTRRVHIAIRKPMKTILPDPVRKTEGSYPSDCRSNRSGRCQVSDPLLRAAKVVSDRLRTPEEFSRAYLTIWGRSMIKALQGVHPLVLLVIATTLEASGDAVVRMAIYNHVGSIRIGLFLAGAALLLGYGSFLNLAPVEFGRVVGLYIATLFVIWQVISFIAFRSVPTMPILVGGALVIGGGAIITLWTPD